MKQMFRVDGNIFIQSGEITYDEKFNQYDDKKQKLFIHSINNICAANLYYNNIIYTGDNTTNLSELESYIKMNNITTLYPVDDVRNNLLIKVTFDARKGKKVLQSKVVFIKATLIPKRAVVLNVNNSESIINFSNMLGALNINISSLHAMLSEYDKVDNISINELDIYLRNTNSKITVDNSSSSNIIFNTNSSIVKEVSTEMLPVMKMELINEEITISPMITDIVLNISIDFSGNNTALMLAIPDSMFIAAT